MTQPEFSFEVPRGKTDTSVEAAIKINPHAPTLRSLVYQLISTAPNGLTTTEIADQSGRNYRGIQPRTSELYKNGFIQDSGDRRRNEYGNNEIVWITGGNNDQ